MTSKSVVLIGVGEMGGVFARGFLKLGVTVVPATRQTNLNDLADVNPEAVIVGVGEKDLQGVLKSIPEQWQDRLVLLQNELLPSDWLQHNITPTVISVWFEKKYPNDFKVIIPSPVYGPHAQLIHDALGAINISVKVCQSEEELLFELILKNLYIITTNVSGLKVGGNVGELWENEQNLAREVASNVLDVQFLLAGKELDREKLITAMVEAFNGDLEHKCMGRSAPARLERALSLADEAGLDVPALRSIASAQSAS